jgi:hypothetical protein
MMLDTKNPKSIKKYLLFKKSKQMPKTTFPSYGVNWHNCGVNWCNYGVNPRSFECLEIKLLMGLRLRFGMNTFYSPMYHGHHWLWNGGHWSSGPTNISTVQIKGIQHIDCKVMVHSRSDWRHFCWATAFIFHDGVFQRWRPKSQPQLETALISATRWI